MYFDYKDLISSIDSGDLKIKNYFDTFGFVVIKNIVNKNDFKRLMLEYDYQYETRTGELSVMKMLINRLGFSGQKRFGFRKILSSIKNRGGMRFLPNFVDGSEYYTSFFLGNRFKSIYRYFAGENWLYLGSDGSNFITTSFPWHRDWFTKIPILKFNFYYNPLPFLGGRFLIIPGSNFSDDSYAHLIQKCMSWPMQNKKIGGLSENSRIPQTYNPRDYFKNLYRRYIRREKLIEVPHVRLALGKGDLVIFDHRAVHCVENNWPKFQRRLMTVLISKNAFDFPEKHYLFRDNTRESLMREIIDLVVGERNHIKCPPYGDALIKTNFVKTNNFIRIESTSSDGIYNLGTILNPAGGEFKSEFDFDYYAKIGRDYRSYFSSLNHNIKNANDISSQNYSYADVHLGVNSQNLKDIES